MTMTTIDRLRQAITTAGAVRAATGTTTGAEGGSSQGRDDTGLVWLTARSDGRVDAVHIDDRWFAGRGAGGLGPALMQAYRAALAGLMTAVAEAADQPVRPPEPAAAPVAPAGSGSPGRVTFEDVRDALWARDRRLADRRARTAAPAETLRGPYGFVTITVRDRDVAVVEVDPRAPRDRSDQIARDALAAFQQLGAGHADQL